MLGDTVSKFSEQQYVTELSKPVSQTSSTVHTPLQQQTGVHQRAWRVGAAVVARARLRIEAINVMDFILNLLKEVDGF
jgi:hypothetical protein